MQAKPVSEPLDLLPPTKTATVGLIPTSGAGAVMPGSQAREASLLPSDPGRSTLKPVPLVPERQSDSRLRLESMAEEEPAATATTPLTSGPGSTPHQGKQQQGRKASPFRSITSPKACRPDGALFCEQRRPTGPPQGRGGRQ